MLKPLSGFKQQVAFICLLLMLSNSGCTLHPNSGQVTITPMPSWMIKSSDLAFTEFWRYRLGNRSNSWYITVPPHLFITNSTVIIGELTQETAPSDALITALSLESGKMLWQTQIKNPGHGTDIVSAFLDEHQKRLYLFFPFLVKAMDLETGQILWTSKNLPEHTSYAFSSQSSSPLILNTDRKKQIGIDPQNGDILFQQETNDELMTIQYGSMKLMNAGVGYLTAVDEKTGQYLWQKTMYRPAMLYPLILDKNRLLAQFGPAVYFISCMDIQTGRDIWTTPRNIVSNFALMENRLFALQENGTLAAFDVESGQYLGGIAFDRGIPDPGEAPYWLATSPPYLLVYFGDTHELIAFRSE